MAARRPSTTLGERLRSRRLFVGRAREVDLFQAALARPDAARPVFHVHGPGGIGKTSLLDVFEAAAGESGFRVARIDARDLDPAPPALLDALGAELGVPGEDALARAERSVVLLDSYERLGLLDGWIRGRLLPALPATSLVVLAGRTPPAAEWRSDPVWRDAVEIVALRNLSPGESREYLGASGVDTALHEQIVRRSHGHPLGLSLLADVVTRGGDVRVEPLDPDLVGTLLRRFLDVVPSTAHRRAVEVCGLARVTTEALLREALDVPDAHDLFTWLRGLSFVESGVDGLFPHDLARDTLVADLCWRDRDAYERLFRGIRTHLVGRLRTSHGREQLRLLYDAKYMHRYQPVSRVWTDWEAFGEHYPEPARPEDWPEVSALVAKWEGAEAEAAAALWWRRQPEAFQVVRRGDGQISGFHALLELSRARPEDRDADPVTRVAWQHVQRLGVPPAGEAVTHARFAVDRDVYQQPSATMNLAPVLTIQHWLTTPGLPLGLITIADPDRWEGYFAFFEIRRVEGADVDLGGRRYGLFARDFRSIPVDAWLELMLERDATGELAATAAVAMSQPEFESAVRQALRDLRRPDLLARNPLVGTAVVRKGGKDPANALAGVLRAASERLCDDPRDAKLHRVLDRTFLRPAATQEKAAEVLDLPLSTYKRHLRRAVERVVTTLWHEELRSRNEPEVTRDRPGD